jgi:hypothetical protein
VCEKWNAETQRLHFSGNATLMPLSESTSLKTCRIAGNTRRPTVAQARVAWQQKDDCESMATFAIYGTCRLRCVV